ICSGRRGLPQSFGAWARPLQMSRRRCSAGTPAGSPACFSGHSPRVGHTSRKPWLFFDPANRASYAGLLPLHVRVPLRGQFSFMLACLGNLDQALRHSDWALDEARRLSHAPTLAIALTCTWLTGWVGRLEPRSLLRVADEQLAITTEHGLEHFRMWALIE